MQVKKTMKLLMLAMCALLIIAGCSSKDNSGSQGAASSAASETPAGSQAAETEEAPVLDPVELSIYYPGNEQKDVALVEERLNELLKDKINATVKIHATGWGDWAQKINLMVSGGEPFDLMFTAGWDNFSGNVAKGAFRELNGLLDEYAVELKNSLDPIYLSAASVGDKIYGVPVQKELAQQFGLVLNKALVEKYGFDLSTVHTIKDIEPMLQTIKENEPDIVPLWANRNLNGLLPFEPVGNGQIPGAIYKNGDTKIVNQFEAPETIELLDLLRDWKGKGYFQDDPATLVDATPYTKSGRVFAQHQQLKPGKDVEFSLQQGQEYVQVELTGTYTSNGDVNGALTAISRTSKNPERAMMLINLLYTDAEVLNTLVFGVEGVHYEKTGDTIKQPEGLAESGYTPGINWMFGNQFLNYLWDNEDPQKWEKFKQFNESATPSPLLGFSYDAEPVKNEEAAIINIYEQYIDALFTGVADPAVKLPEFIDKMKKAGLDKVIAEKQKQVDAFLGN
ncbi:ABC transporter substrate-binding protein [Cohnella cellulosilytica]|uniref:ABC transporter substrate-binding protein n=1 Tax=Cohnella cellulosilytica TaxID=986710 RepID=A0ABW2F7G1_9BACL